MTQPAPPMSLFPLGKTTVKVPPLGIGTWQWGDHLLWGYGRGYADADLEAAFQAALKAGITFFDTAEVYGRGRSERLLGRFMAAEGREVAVATKFLPYPWRLHPAALPRALQNSLARLGMGRVDLYQIHWPFPPVPIATWVDTLADVVESGLALTVGVSNYNTSQMHRAHEVLARRGIPLASNQVDYSLLRRDPERSGLLAACHELDVTLIAYSPLAQGLLTGKYTPKNPPPGLRRFRTSHRSLVKLQPLVALLQDLGQDHGKKTPAQVALNWLVCKGALPIPGVKNAHQVEENAGALGWRLTPTQIAALDEASQDLP